MLQMLIRMVVALSPDAPLLRLFYLLLLPVLLSALLNIGSFLIKSLFYFSLGSLHSFQSSSIPASLHLSLPHVLPPSLSLYLVFMDTPWFFMVLHSPHRHFSISLFSFRDKVKLSPPSVCLYRDS